jgi:hypothetical protein
LYLGVAPSEDPEYRCISLSLSLEKGRSNLAKLCASIVYLFVDKLQVNNVSEKIILFYFPLVSTGCTTWPLTLRKESKLRIFRNRVLKGIGTERKERPGKLEKS